MTVVYTYGYETMTLPRKGLKTRPYGVDMEDHIVTLPKRGLKTRPYSMDIATLPKKGLKTRPYNIGMEKMDLKTRPYSIDMEKKDLKKLTEGQLIKLLLTKVSSHEDLLDSDPFKDEVTQEPTERIKPTPPPRTGKWENVKPEPIPRKSVNKDLILPPDGYKPIPKPRTDRPLQIQNTLEVTFEKDTVNSKTGKRISIYKTAFFNGKAKTITKSNDIEPELNRSRQEILNTIDKWVSEGSGWVID